MSEFVRRMRSEHNTLLIVVVIGLAFFTYYMSITESEYSLRPKGDARTYTLMTLHFGTPEKVGEAMPSIYSRRLFPAFVAHALMYPYIRRHRSEINAITTSKDLSKADSIPINRSVLSAWQLSNFIAYLLQLFFIFKLLSYLKIDRSIRIYMLVIYSMWFLSVRLYVNWAQMPDPWAFTFLCAAAYFLVTYNAVGFFISVLLGSLSKEMLLFAIPSFMWLSLRRDRPGVFLMKSIPIALIPVGLFIFMRAYPYFPSMISTPNMHFLDKGTVASGTWFRDYLELIYYHTSYRMRYDAVYFMDTLLIPVGAFTGLSFLLIRHYKETGRFLRENAYWIPYILLTAAIGLNVDRYIFYIFPVVIIISAKILDSNYEGNRRYFIMGLLFVITAWSQGLPSMPADVADITLKHQLEISALLRPELARQFRVLLGEAALVAVAGFIIASRIGPVKKKAKKVL